MSEVDIHIALANYIRVQFPDIPFMTDAVGLNLSRTQRGQLKAMRYKRGWPDLFVAATTDEFAGLFIEIKHDDVPLRRPKDAKKILKDDYKLRKEGDWYNLHIEEQANMLTELKGRGYEAVFATGFDSCKEVVDEYLKDYKDDEIF